MQEKVKLSDWAKINGKSYRQAWELYNKGELPVKTSTNKKGSIYVLQETKASENKKIEFAIPSFADYEETKASAIRRNRSGTIKPTDQYYHIENGLDVFTSGRSGKTGNDTINVSEAIRLVRKCYYNFSDLMNIVNTLVEFSTSPIYYRGGSAKSRKFFEVLFNKVGIMNLQQKFFMEYYRSCNVFPYRFESIIKKEDINNLNKTFGIKAANDVKLPTKYIIIDPSSVIVGGNISFVSPLFYQRLNSYEIQRLIKPITDEDKAFFNSLPDEIKSILKKNGPVNQQIDIPLNPDYVYFIFYKKQDYEPMAVPMAWPVLKDINAKQELKQMDMATARTVMRAILHIKMGFENKNGEIFIDQKAMSAMNALFTSESIGKVLVTDFTTEIEWKIPDISQLLGVEKYKQLNDDIRSGLNNILIGTDEKFANQSIKVKLFIQRLQQSREVFINEFLLPEIKRIAKMMGFKSYPQPYFQDIDFKDQDLWNRIVNQLVQLGVLTSWEATKAIEDGILPDKDESIQNQREFKQLKEEGLYQAVQLNPSGQIELLDKQGKVQLKVQDQQLQYKTKEADKQRNHEINNPKPEPPQIHINAPGLKQPKGRPSGTTGIPKNQSKPAKPSRASELYSLFKIRENLVLASKLDANLKEMVCKNFKIKQLNKEQELLIDSLLGNIMCSELPENWLKKETLSKYIKNPDLIDEERMNDIRGIGERHTVDDYLASILYNSSKEEV